MPSLSAHFIVLEAGHAELLVIIKVMRVACVQEGEKAVRALLDADLGEWDEGDVESGH